MGKSIHEVIENELSFIILILKERMRMQINIHKSVTPIIWLDTFFVIEYGKIVIGESKDERYRTLYDILSRKIREKKLLCARAEQEDELEGNIDISMSKFLELTRNYRFKLGSQVRTLQSNRMMRAYLHKLKSFDILQSDVSTSSKESRDGFIVNVYSTPNEDALMEKKRIKYSNLKEVQDFKDTQNPEITFNEIMEREYKGIYVATIHLISKIATLMKMFDGELYFDKNLYNQFTGLVIEPMEEWCKLTGKEMDIDGYLEFLISEEHKAIPHIDISTHLISDLMASKKKLETGDLKDVENLSSFLPYCNFILTDTAQHNRLKRQALDKKYDVCVFCMKNINELIEIVDKL